VGFNSNRAQLKIKAKGESMSTRERLMAKYARNERKEKQRQAYIGEILVALDRHEYDGPINDQPAGYRGEMIEINDHGNITVFKCFKNGNRREIASRV
jgi:hypothetical protein